MQDYSKMNPNDFSQKDLMLHLLQVAQHTVTREELKEDISELKNDISKVDARFDKVDARFNKVDDRFNKVDDRFDKVDDRFDKMNDKISKLETSLKQDISKVDAKFDKIQWLIIATMITVVLKDYLFSLITPVVP